MASAVCECFFSLALGLWVSVASSLGPFPWLPDWMLRK